MQTLYATCLPGTCGPVLHRPRAWVLSPTSCGAATRHGAKGLGTAVPTPCRQDSGQRLSLLGGGGGPGCGRRPSGQAPAAECLAALLLVGLGNSWGLLACGLHAEVAGPQHRRVTPDDSPR